MIKYLEILQKRIFYSALAIDLSTPMFIFKSQFSFRKFCANYEMNEDPSVKGIFEQKLFFAEEQLFFRKVRKCFLWPL